MTEDQLHALADIISKKIIAYLDQQFNMQPIEPMDPEEFFHKSIDAFGNFKRIDKKTMIATQLKQLEATRDQRLSEEKYELLSDLKEIYEKLKKEDGSL